MYRVPHNWTTGYSIAPHKDDHSCDQLRPHKTYGGHLCLKFMVDQMWGNQVTGRPNVGHEWSSKYGAPFNYSTIG